jgi:hypothetical protein
MAWKKNRDPLFRGDSAAGIAVPDPAAETSIVDHILYLGGPGRATCYQSTTEAEEVATQFAGKAGKVYRTTAPRAETHGVGHLSQVELKNLLRGNGHGRAKTSSALLVMQARRYVELNAEHLLDFAHVPSKTVAQVVKDVYES